MPEITLFSKSKCFGGWQKHFSHESSELKCMMNFGVYLPPQAENGDIPVIYYLPGMGGNESDFIIKAGAQKYAAQYGVILVAVDTSPRGEDVVDGIGWNIGKGAGFYVDATEDPWKKNYRMYSYVTKELSRIIDEKFPVLAGQQSIMGHSMGGHGALICAMKNPGMYKSVSAFAPVSNPVESDFAKEAFAEYLGPDVEKWKEYDATHLVKKYSGPLLNILIDQGTEDSLDDLMPENFSISASQAGVPFILQYREGYDHGYHFVSSFVEEHIKHHIKYLKN